jgi:SAM-dependent methyltransferase
MKSEKVVKSNFNRLWDEQTDVSALGKIIFRIDRKRIFSFLKYTDINKNSRIVDVGCGTGSTLRIFRKLGYKNSIGIDVAESSMNLCKRNKFKRNKDVFKIDVTSAPRKMKKKFDIVFTEGSIEHYENIQPMVNSICDLSKKYVLTTMPDLNAFYWQIAPFFYRIMRRKRVDDYNHDEWEYENSFKKAGFKLVKKRKFLLRSGWIMLFERVK